MLKFLCETNLHFFARIYLKINKKKYIHSEILERHIIRASTWDNYMIIKILLPYLDDEQYRKVHASIIETAFKYTINNKQFKVIEGNSRFYSISNENKGIESYFVSSCRSNKKFITNTLFDKMELNDEQTMDCINASIYTGNFKLLKKLIDNSDIKPQINRYDFESCYNQIRFTNSNKKIIDYVIKWVNDDYLIIKMCKEIKINYKELLR